VCCVMEGRWKTLNISYWSVKTLSGIDGSSVKKIAGAEVRVKE